MTAFFELEAQLNDNSKYSLTAELKSAFMSLYVVIYVTIFFVYRASTAFSVTNGGKYAISLLRNAFLETKEI